MTRYEGHVVPGGTAITRTIHTAGGEVEVRKFSVGPMDNNVYLLTAAASRETVLIDAANDGERIVAELDGLDVVAIVTTHGHGDHWQALDAVAGVTGAPVWLHAGDADMMQRAADVASADGDVISFGESSVTLIHTPGHTPGSTCVLLGDAHVFTGDTLFPGGPGNTFGNAEAFTQIMQSLRERLFVLPDETWVYPGHGDDTTIGRERPNLDEWQQRGW